MSLRSDIPDKFIDINGINVRYLEKGSGRPLLCLNGMGSSLSADQYLPHIDAFSKFSHVYAMDLPGWGMTDLPKSGPSFQMWADTVKGFVTKLGLQEIDILGYSIGGWIACRYANEDQDRVRRMMLLDSPGLNIEAPAFVSQFNMPTKEQVKDGLVLHMKNMSVTDQMVDEVWRRMTRPGWEANFRAISGYIGNTEVRKQHSLHAVFPNLKFPILFSQMDNAGAVLIKFIFEGYQLAPNGRIFIYYGGSSRLVAGIVPEAEKTAIEFFTAAEVPAVARK